LGKKKGCIVHAIWKTVFRWYLYASGQLCSRTGTADSGEFSGTSDEEKPPQLGYFMEK